MIFQINKQDGAIIMWRWLRLSLLYIWDRREWLTRLSAVKEGYVLFLCFGALFCANALNCKLSLHDLRGCNSSLNSLKVLSVSSSTWLNHTYVAVTESTSFVFRGDTGHGYLTWAISVLADLRLPTTWEGVRDQLDWRMTQPVDYLFFNALLWTIGQKSSLLVHPWTCFCFYFQLNGVKWKSGTECSICLTLGEIAV